MSKTYTQCKLKQDNLIEISWIPTQFAIRGRSILIDELGKWEVVEAYTENNLPVEMIDLNRNAIRHMETVARL